MKNLKQPGDGEVRAGALFRNGLAYPLNEFDADGAPDAMFSTRQVGDEVGREVQSDYSVEHFHDFDQVPPEPRRYWVGMLLAGLLIAAGLVFAAFLFLTLPG